MQILVYVSLKKHEYYLNRKENCEIQWTFVGNKMEIM